MSEPDRARVSAAGAWVAVARARRDADVEPLLALLSRTDTPVWDDAAHAPLARLGLVERVARVETVPAEPLERFLPEVLGSLSDRGRVVLSESRQGLFLDCAGLSRDDAERLAVTGSGLSALLRRDPVLPDARLGVHGAALAIVDPDGHAEVGFWPLHVGRYVFMLTVFGIPRFTDDGFRRLVWVLQQRYGGEAHVPGGGGDVGAAFGPGTGSQRPPSEP